MYFNHMITGHKIGNVGKIVKINQNFFKTNENWSKKNESHSLNCFEMVCHFEITFLSCAMHMYYAHEQTHFKYMRPARDQFEIIKYEQK